MSQAYIGEIRLVGFNFAPVGWMFCQGQLLSIAQHSALFSLIGTFYGGDGQVTFGLPDLRGRVPRHHGTGPGLSTVDIGEVSGTESVTLLSGQLPSHSHLLHGSTGDATTSVPTGNMLSVTHKPDTYGPAPGNTLMNPASLASAGQSSPHENRPPYLALNYVIAVEGIYPSRA